MLQLQLRNIPQVMKEGQCKFYHQEQFGVVCNNGDYVVFQCRMLKAETNVSFNYKFNYIWMLQVALLSVELLIQYFFGIFFAY